MVGKQETAVFSLDLKLKEDFKFRPLVLVEKDSQATLLRFYMLHLHYYYGHEFENWKLIFGERGEWRGEAGIRKRMSY